MQPPPPPPGAQPSWGSPHPYYASFAPKPGCVPLRPLTVSDILDGSFQTVRRNPRATLGLSAGFAVAQVSVLAIFQIVLFSQLHDVTADSADPTTPPVSAGQVVSLLSSAFSVIVLSAIFGAVLTGMLTLVITEDVLGTRLSLNQVWPRVRPRLGVLIGASLLIAVVQLIGLALFIAPGVWLWGIWALAVPALMVEGTGVRASLRRSRELVRGTFWRVWGIRALGTLIVTVLSGLAATPFTLLALFVSGRGFSDLTSAQSALPVAYILITSIGSIVTTTFTAPVKAGIDALLYVDQRMRKEGLDIVLQQEAAQRGVAAAYGPGRTY